MSKKLDAPYWKQYYETHKEDRKKQAREYYARNRDSSVEYSRDYRKTHKADISDNKKRYYNDKKDVIKERRKAYTEMNYAHVRWYGLCRRAAEKGWQIAPEEEFIQWYNDKDKVCCYCGISEDRLASQSWKNMRKMTIDRKNNSLGYTLDNIELACYRCNNIKGAVFTYDEFIKIANDCFKQRLEEYHKIT